MLFQDVDGAFYMDAMNGDDGSLATPTRFNKSQMLDLPEVFASETSIQTTVPSDDEDANNVSLPSRKQQKEIHCEMPWRDIIRMSDDMVELYVAAARKEGDAWESTARFFQSQTTSPLAS